LLLTFLGVFVLLEEIFFLVRKLKEQVILSDVLFYFVIIETGDCTHKLLHEGYRHTFIMMLGADAQEVFMIGCIPATV